MTPSTRPICRSTDRRCGLSFEAEDTADRFVFVADEHETRIADFVNIAGSKVSGLRLVERVATSDTFVVYHADLPRVSRLHMRIEIEGKRSVLSIGKFIGYTVAFLIASLVYLVSAEQLGVRVGLITSAIFATAGTRFSLDAVLGVKSAFGLVDHLSLMVFAATRAVLTVSILVPSHLQDQPAQASRAGRSSCRDGSVSVFLTLTITGFVVARG